MLACFRKYKLVIAAFLVLIVGIYSNNYVPIWKTTGKKYANQAWDIAHQNNNSLIAKLTENKQIPAKIIKSALNNALFHSLLQNRFYYIGVWANSIKYAFNSDSFLHKICVLII